MQLTQQIWQELIMGHCKQEAWVLSMQDLASERSATGSVVSPAAMTVQLVDGDFETAFAACGLTVKLVPDDRERLASGDSQGSSYTLDSNKTNLQGNDNAATDRLYVSSIVLIPGYSFNNTRRTPLYSKHPSVCSSI